MEIGDDERELEFAARFVEERCGGILSANRNGWLFNGFRMIFFIGFLYDFFIILF